MKLVQEVALDYNVSSHVVRQAAGELGISITADDEIVPSAKLQKRVDEMQDEWEASKRG